MKRLFLLIAAVTLGVTTAFAQQSAELTTEVKSNSESRFLPTTRRVDRNIDLNKFVYKGEWMLGIAASYGTLDVSDSDLMLLFDDINLGLRRTAVLPYVAYAYRDNRAVGMRFGYEFLKADLGNAALDLGSLAEDISFEISDIGIRSESFNYSLFHRNYIGLDRRGIVGVIMEGELLIKTGTTTLMSGAGDELTRSDSRNFGAQLNFNPGLGVYVFPQVCLTVTVGVGGLYYNNVRQFDLEGNVIGRRDRSGLSFKLNIADIQIGLVAHLWNKKK